MSGIELALGSGFTDGDNKLDAYATKLKESNSGSDVMNNLSKETLDQGKKILLKMYICFKAMKMGFKKELRPFIELDGTFLKGKANRHVLVAVGQDKMKYYYPLACAIVD
ncbi:hypothetical protein H5410_021644 [Solanum commersonii]|uniref:Uncharacterized protein n=1 Tax=Solanum commersonii TaxID=4109 RepID=A0A9J5ZBK8_SOLCO|nr:hypothetical protein H5410_021644 [Solanum commersonii]